MTAKTITSQRVAEALYQAIPSLASVLPDDVVSALVAARAIETNPRGQLVLDQLLENARIAAEGMLPICQDTAAVWVCLEIGPDVALHGDVFSGVDEAVARAYRQAHLRKSLVRDALFDRSNTGDNTPAFCEIISSTQPSRARLHVMLKGCGSDNASRVVMFPPSAGKQGIVDEVLACIRAKAANACAPVVVGIGIGSTFDRVAGLAKHALMRRIDEAAPDAQSAALEAELLSLVNQTGIGPGGLGGATTALAVKVNTAPCHIGALPLAINMGCCAMRRASIEL